MYQQVDASRIRCRQSHRGRTSMCCYQPAQSFAQSAARVPLSCFEGLLSGSGVDPTGWQHARLLAIVMKVILKSSQTSMSGGGRKDPK
jgi:hypothetical protein